MLASNRNNIVLKALVGTTILACSSGAMAEDDESGPYLGAAYGQFDVTIENLEGVTDAVQDLDTDSDAFKVFFGWRLNPYVSFEADYIDLGNADGGFEASGTSGQYSLELSGFGAYAIGTLPLGIFELSGKLGYYFHDVTVDVDLENIGPGNGNVLGTDDNGEAWAYGIGAGITFLERINAKLEYEVMDLDDLEDPYTFWLTAAWRF
jgi:hypothetical protein